MTGYLGVSVLPVAALPVASAATAVPAPVIAPGSGDGGGAPVPAATVPPFTALLPQPPAHGPQDVSTLSFSAGAGTAGAADPVAELAPAGLVLLAILSSLLSGRRRVR